MDARLLDVARSHGIDAVRTEVHAILTELAGAHDAVLCTCSTLGPLADEAAQTAATILRIDRPLMVQACADGENILVALCLDSTRAATLALLQTCAAELGQDIKPTVVICDTAWAFFEAGDMDGYAASIAASVGAAVASQDRVNSIVLAQASMRVAETKLGHLGIPVRSSPALAVAKCLDTARAGGRGS